MNCQITKNKSNCNCTYEPCLRKGKCCLCIQYHRSMRELPACFFPADIEKTFDRSYERFVREVNTGEI